MPNLAKILARALVSGTVASVTSTAALAFLAQREGKSALQPLNATSHWLHGEAAAEIREANLANTAVGYATHHAATVFWACFFEWWVATRRPAGRYAILKGALGTVVVAAAVDYGATPKRFTPGWEFVLSKQAMAAVYLCLAVGLTIAALDNGATGSRRQGP